MYKSEKSSPLMYLFIIALSAAAYPLRAQTLNPKLKALSYMLGNWNVKTYHPNGKGGWKIPTTGKAEYATILEGTFIREKVKFNTGKSTLTMFNILGIDPRTKKLRMIAMDKEFGTMDVYKGDIQGRNAYLSNLRSDERFEDKAGNHWAFRLSFTFISNDEFSLLVEYTKNDGKSWKIFQKNVYHRATH